MGNPVTILGKFNRYHPREEYREILDQASDVRIRTDTERRMVEVFAAFPAIVPKSTLYDIEKEICEAYQLNGARLFPRYPANCFTRDYLP